MCFVVVSHAVAADQAGLTLGAVGVTIFFTLSGFLITGLLMGPGHESLRHLPAFFAARAARLVPALLAVVAFTAPIWALTGRPKGEFLHYAAAALFYIENFLFAEHNQTIFAHTWSLAVEEQFYIFWPIVLICTIRLKVVLRLAAVAILILVSAAVRWHLYHTPSVGLAYFSLPTNAYALMLGGFLRMAPVKCLERKWVGWIALAALALLGSAGTHLPDGYAVSPILAACLTCFVIVGCLRGNRLLEAPVVLFLGKVSYAWYLWHWVLLWLTGQLHSGWSSMVISAVALLVAAGSTLLIEDPVRRAYQRWLRSGRSPQILRPQLDRPRGSLAA